MDAPSKGFHWVYPLLLSLLIVLPSNALYAPSEARSSGCTEEICISEVMPNPAGNDATSYPDGEWVELRSRTGTTVNASGWILQTESGGESAIGSSNIVDWMENDSATWTISNDERLLIDVGSDTSLNLRNTNDELRLLSPNRVLSHKASWSSAASNRSYVADSLDPTSEWIKSDHSTPGYSGGEPLTDGPCVSTVCITEVMPNPEDTDLRPWPNGEWVEIQNRGNISIDLEGWSLRLDDGHYLTNFTLKDGNGSTTNSTLNSNERVVIAINGSPDFVLTNTQEILSLVAPNGSTVHVLSWNDSGAGISLADDDGDQNWTPTLFPTPGHPSVTAQILSPPPKLVFNRIMPGQIHNRDDEWFEIESRDQRTIDLLGWTFRRYRSTGAFDDGIIREHLLLKSGDKLAISHNASLLPTYGGPVSLEGEQILTEMPWMYDSGGSIQWIDPGGRVIDTVAYGETEEQVEGWNGRSIQLPGTAIEGLVLSRGTGCGTGPDTDSAPDWEYRWSRLGASQFCDGGGFSGPAQFLPMAAPNTPSLGPLIDWIENAQFNLSVAMYELMGAEIVDALIGRVSAGVNVTILLEEDPLDELEDLLQIRGMAADLHDAGAHVLWIGAPKGENLPAAPYTYLHAKIGVRDAESVWIGSGNWKHSSFPYDGRSGNRERGLIIESAELSTLVSARLAWDAKTSNLYSNPFDPSDPETNRPNGWERPTADYLRIGQRNTTLISDGSADGRLLTCPDDCVTGLVELIDNASKSIDLSLQYLDPDWDNGWGTNPVISALHDAAVRGVRLRLVLNGYYLTDPRLNEALTMFNDEWNRSGGLDATAILMSPSEQITKLHDKGMLIDGEWSLISSINWGSSSMLRNREYGLAIRSQDLHDWYAVQFEDDWYRLDNQTDSDGDHLPDYWEIEHGFNRTHAVDQIFNQTENETDHDGDGLDAWDEYRIGSNPRSFDTDGDCISDSIEQAWAVAIGIDVKYVVRELDANANGIPDGEETRCGSAELFTDGNQSVNSTNSDKGSLLGMKTSTLSIIIAVFGALVVLFICGAAIAIMRQRKRNLA